MRGTSTWPWMCHSSVRAAAKSRLVCREPRVCRPCCANVSCRLTFHGDLRPPCASAAAGQNGNVQDHHPGLERQDRHVLHGWRASCWQLHANHASARWRPRKLITARPLATLCRASESSCAMGRWGGVQRALRLIGVLHAVSLKQNVRPCMCVVDVAVHDPDYIESMLMLTTFIRTRI